MGRFSELDIDDVDFKGDDDDFLEDDFVPTNEAAPQTEIEEIRLQIQAALFDLTSAEKDLEELIFRWRYYHGRPEKERLEHILAYITSVRKTLK